MSAMWEANSEKKRREAEIAAGTAFYRWGNGVLAVRRDDGSQKYSVTWSICGEDVGKRGNVQIHGTVGHWSSDGTGTRSAYELGIGSLLPVQGDPIAFEAHRREILRRVNQKKTARRTPGR